MTGAEALRELAAVADTLPEREGRVRLDASGPVARLRLDAPRTRNAVSVAMMLELARALDTLEAFDGAAVILEATPCGVFCAGGHLGDVRAALARPDRGLVMARAMTWVLDRLLALPCVTVAAVDGLALGGGAELVTACDHRVLSRDARIHFVQARLGVAPGWGGAARLVAHVGRPTALRLLSSAAPIDAEQARSLGLADAVVDGPAADGALSWLEPVLALPTSAVRAVKAQVASAAPVRHDDAEARRFAEVWGGPAHHRALGG